jgi:hypothetical protein
MRRTLRERFEAPVSGGPLLAAAVWGLFAANLVVLWRARGDAVTGFELFGPSAGVLWVHESGFSGALHRFADAIRAQRFSGASTGARTFLYGLLPGLLTSAAPWLYWSNVEVLVLCLLSLLWTGRRLRIPVFLLAACCLASPALTAMTIVGFPWSSSPLVTFGLSLTTVLRPARGRLDAIWDLLAFAGITAVAFNSYQSGQMFFIVPLVAAVTLPDVSWSRRLAWLLAAGAVWYLMAINMTGSSVAALAAVPREPVAFAQGMLLVVRRYLIDWYLDGPALGVAAVLACLFLRRHRWFWTLLLGGVFVLCGLGVFQFPGAPLLAPRRFVPFVFVAAIAVATALVAPGLGGWRRLALALLVAVGIADTTRYTVAFALAEKPVTKRDYNVDRVYSLPFCWSGLDMQIWRDRIQDARRLRAAIEAGPETHLFWYDFSVEAEDGVNPQLLPARLLLPLGYERFTRQTVFFGKQADTLEPIRFPIRPLTEVGATVRGTPVPFYVHVKEPEWSAADIQATVFAGATVTPVDLGLFGFRSFRVDAMPAN